MQAEIEARYLSLEWLDRGKARQVEVAPDPLEMERGDDGVLRVESLIFHDFHPWVGLNLSGQLTSCKPAFVDAQGTQRPMLAVEDSGGLIWWVQDDGWDAKGQRHLSELHRTMGRFEVRIGDERLLIESRTTGLGSPQIDEYLQEFKGDLLWLILGSGSATASGSGSGSYLAEELLVALSDFTAAVARVSMNPARTLREVSVDTLRSRVRPNAATFRQHARLPTKRRLVGRASEETADIAENRYLRHMLQTGRRLALATAKAVQQQANRFAERGHFEHERSLVYAETRSRVVDPEIFDRQLAELTQKLDNLAAWSGSTPTYKGEDHQSYNLNITAQYKGRGQNDAFFFNKPEGPSAYDITKGIHYNVVCLPIKLANQVAAALNFCKTYTLSGRPVIKIESYKKGNYRLVNFFDVAGVTPGRQAIESKLHTRERLEGNKWKLDLSQSERSEMQREARTAALRAKIYSDVGERSRAASTGLASCHAALSRQDAHLQFLGVLPQPAFPMGMRYALSPDYAAVLKTHTRVRELADRAGIGEASLDELDRVNILHVSAIYERWCLLKIIGVLMEDFLFEPRPGWQEVVIRAVTGRPESRELRFDRHDGISATLELQPELVNGRRPDFRLKFNIGSDADGQIGGVVLDAKFRTQWHRGELSALLNELIDTKSYGQGGDRVFILQPQAYGISDPTSPLIWGRHCDFGQDLKKNHRGGSIHLAAGVLGGGTQNHLRRLVAMELQAVFPVPVQNKESWTSESFCIRCGVHHEPSDIQHRTTLRGKDYWELRCGQCGMWTVRTHCYECSESLFKNGTDLTYHRTLADQVTNVVCPKCAAYFDQDIHDVGANRKSQH